ECQPHSRPTPGPGRPGLPSRRGRAPPPPCSSPGGGPARARPGGPPAALARAGAAARPPGPGGGRGRAPPARGEPVAVLVGDAEGRAGPWPGSVIDRSPTGLCVAVGQGVAVGALLTLRPAAAPPGVAPVAVGVANCRKEGGHYLLGCRFVQMPP